MIEIFGKVREAARKEIRELKEDWEGKKKEWEVKWKEWKGRREFREGNKGIENNIMRQRY